MNVTLIRPEVFIHVDDISANDIVVCNYQGRPGILTKNTAKKNTYSFTVFGSGFSMHPTAITIDHETAKDAIIDQIEDKSPVAAFPGDQWREALTWLLDNCK